MLAQHYDAFPGVNYFLMLRCQAKYFLLRTRTGPNRPPNLQPIIRSLTKIAGMNSSSEEEIVIPKKKKGVTNKPEKSVEEIYQKKSQLEHILIRPDTYIGSVEKIKTQMWVYDTESSKMKFKAIEFVPGLYKIFDEIIVNAADNKAIFSLF